MPPRRTSVNYNADGHSFLASLFKNLDFVFRFVHFRTNNPEMIFSKIIDFIELTVEITINVQISVCWLMNCLIQDEFSFRESICLI